MSAEVAFIGDVHGNIHALDALWDVLSARGELHAVFLGDYINKGADSAAVMEKLIAYSGTGRATLLLGNHEIALLEALDTGDLAPFLKMGGAMTIRSYVGARVGPDVLSEFRAGLPVQHIDAIRGMAETFELDDVIAEHVAPPSSTSKFRVSAHLPIGDVPRIYDRSAQIDTGCGGEDGRLTALLWPGLDYVQVDVRGNVVAHDQGRAAVDDH